MRVGDMAKEGCRALVQEMPPLLATCPIAVFRRFPQSPPMGSAKKPKDPPPPPPPVSTTGADVAQETTAARKKERNRYDFSKTILRSGLGGGLPDGTKKTLG